MDRNREVREMRTAEAILGIIRERMQKVAARRRKSLAVCQTCHHDVHYGRYDGPAISKSVAGELR